MLNITKDKIPKFVSYALKSSWLERELKIANIDTRIDLTFFYSEVFFEACYWLPNQHVPCDRFYLRTGVVKSELRQQAQQKMKQETVPQFIDWAQQILSLPPNSTRLNRQLYFLAKF